MTSSYDRCYLPEAKTHLGRCTDYLLRDCALSPEAVANAYANAGVMRLFEKGDPGTIAGRSGIELGQEIWGAIHGPDVPCPKATSGPAGNTPEYWGGWALAHFQWYWCRSFRWIFERTTMTELISRYRVYHEMNITRFLEDFMEDLRKVTPEPHLRKIRLAAGLSQSQLAKKSGVNIRNIQLYEQRVQPIDRASATTLAALARPLGCSLEDLLEELF